MGDATLIRLTRTELLQAALTEQVAFVPGVAFFANGGGAHTLRLNFTHTPPERIEQGVIRLRRAMDTRMLSQGTTRRGSISTQSSARFLVGSR